MLKSHRRTLLVVKQTATESFCELPAVSDAITVAQCGGCCGCSGRSNRSENQGFKLPTKLLTQANLSPPDIGQSLELEVPAGMLLALSSLVYLSPVLLMLFFTVCCDLLFPGSEALIAVWGIIGLGIGLGSIVLFGPALRSHITRRLTVTQQPITGSSQ